MSFAEMAAAKIMEKLSIRYWEYLNIMDSPSPDLLISELEIVDIINEAVAKKQYNSK